MGSINFLTEHWKWGINRGEIVVDIGAGNDPILRANILVDKYVESDWQRYSGIIIDRTMVSTDGEKLPFRDKSIDFIHCRHVLEHIPDPDIFLSEISRVGKRGLIVTPNGDYEKLDPRSTHLWYVWIKNDQLFLQQKKSWNENPELSKYFQKITSRRGYWKFYGQNYDLFNSTYYWRDRIDYSINKYGEFCFDQFGKSSNEMSMVSKMKLKIPLKIRAKSFFGKIFRPVITSNININSIICCPQCKGELTSVDKKKYIQCSECSKTYSINKNILHMNL